MSHFKSNNIEEDLQQNLLLYTAPPQEHGPNLFQAHRELSIIRYALSQQFNFYHKAVEVFTQRLQHAEESLQSADSDNQRKYLTDIMVCIQQIEQKSSLLIASAEKVIHLLGDISNLDVDKAALRSLVINLPALVEEAITHTTSDPQIASRISHNLSQNIEKLMKMYRFDDYQQQQNSVPAHIMQDQYLEMINSVPAH